MGHPLYSLNISSRDFYIFGPLEVTFGVHSLADDYTVEALFSFFYEKRIQNLTSHVAKYIFKLEEYVEKKYFIAFFALLLNN